MEERWGTIWICENSGNDYGNYDDHDYESPRRRSSPAARCAPRFAPVLASPGFPERSGPFQSHLLQTATATATATATTTTTVTATAKRPRARSSRTDWDDPYRTSAFPRAARTLAIARSRRDSAHACRAHGIPRRPIRAVASRGARVKLSLTARLPAPRAALSAGRFR